MSDQPKQPDLGQSVSRLRVEGELSLGPEDQARWAAYVDEFVKHDGMNRIAAQDEAWAQIAQDLLGPMGFQVEGIEPL